MASQAAARGHGQVLSDRVYSKLYSLQLVTGGNIIINTSTSPDLPSTQIEAATMGYRFLPPSNPLNRNFPTYSLQGTGLRDGMAAQPGPTQLLPGPPAQIAGAVELANPTTHTLRP